ncbi:MAG: exonuclease domain-containing protein [Patescibacteria group bacterium]|nr:exonuclease domain-containing protein [Patescibacteria group bacterium]
MTERRGMFRLRSQLRNVSATFAIIDKGDRYGPKLSQWQKNELEYIHMKDKLIFLDTETTGNDVLKDRLCQICYKVDGEYHTEYFKPPLPMSVKAMSITHITNKFLADKPPFQGSEMYKEIEALLSKGIMVAHNARFDKAMLESEGIAVPQSICTFRVARYLDSDNQIPEYNLQFLRYFLDLDIDAGVHDAEEDVKVLSGVFERLLAKMIKETGNENSAIAKMIEVSSHPSLFRLFNFGKYKDKKIEEVVKTDRGYLEWMLSRKMEEGGTDEDWIYTLEHYLKN